MISFLFSALFVTSVLAHEFGTKATGIIPCNDANINNEGCWECYKNNGAACRAKVFLKNEYATGVCKGKDKEYWNYKCVSTAESEVAVASGCPMFNCRMFCPHGFTKDANGCDECMCARPTIDPRAASEEAIGNAIFCGTHADCPGTLICSMSALGRSICMQPTASEEAVGNAILCSHHGQCPDAQICSRSTKLGRDICMLPIASEVSVGVAAEEEAVGKYYTEIPEACTLQENRWKPVDFNGGRSITVMKCASLCRENFMCMTFSFFEEKCWWSWRKAYAIKCPWNHSNEKVYKMNDRWDATDSELALAQAGAEANGRARRWSDDETETAVGSGCEYDWDCGDGPVYCSPLDNMCKFFGDLGESSVGEGGCVLPEAACAPCKPNEACGKAGLFKEIVQDESVCRKFGQHCWCPKVYRVVRSCSPAEASLGGSMGSFERPKQAAEARLGSMGSFERPKQAAEARLEMAVASESGEDFTSGSDSAENLPYFPVYYGETGPGAMTEDAVGVVSMDSKRIKYEYAQKGCLPSPYKSEGEGHTVYNCAMKCRHDYGCKQFSMKGSKCWTTKLDYIVKCGWLASNEDVYRILDGDEMAVASESEEDFTSGSDSSENMPYIPVWYGRRGPGSMLSYTAKDSHSAPGHSLVNMLAAFGFSLTIYGAFRYYIK